MDRKLIPENQHSIAPANLKWTSLKLEINEAALWQFANIKIYAQRIQGDWMLARSTSAKTHSSQIISIINSIPIDIDWKRWTLDQEIDTIRFWPVFPDKSILVKTRIPVMVPPQSSVDLFVNLPIWLEVSVVQNELFYILDTIAPETLSNTWYGNYFEGELCYALKSHARRCLEDLSNTPLHAACLCRIHNRSKESLPVEKIRIQPDYLNLYQSGNKLWTSKLTVTFKGSNTNSEVRYSKSAPSHLSAVSILRKAIQTEQKGSLIDRIHFYTHQSEYQ